jgi:hypothetical protein
MKALIQDNKIVQVSPQSFNTHPSLTWKDCPDNCTTDWNYENGSFIAPIPYEPSKEEKLKNYKNALQQHFNMVARQKDYASNEDCASFAGSTNVDWKEQAIAFINWRDDAWTYALNVLSQVESGAIDAPTIDEFINNLPSMIWP